VSFGLELARYADEAQVIVLGLLYAVGASAYKSGEGVKARLDEYLVHVHMGVHILGKRYLYKLGKGGLFQQLALLFYLPKSLM